MSATRPSVNGHPRLSAGIAVLGRPVAAGGSRAATRAPEHEHLGGRRWRANRCPPGHTKRTSRAMEATAGRRRRRPRHRQGLSLKSAAGRWVVAATVLGSGIVMIDGTVVNVALPAIGREFGTGMAALQWTITAYALTLAAFLLVGGSLGDRHGRRRIFVIGVVWFAAASLLCGLAPSIWILIAARALQGVGAALLVPGSLAILQATFRRRGSRAGDRPLVGARGCRDGARPVRGRLLHPGRVVAPHLPHQPAARAGSGLDRAAARARDAR